MRCAKLIVVVALAVGLGGCGFDPLDKLQDLDIMGSTKPPLRGERHAVFPEGVPGVPQGVPPELVKGYQAPVEPPPTPVVEKRERPKPKRVAARPKPKAQTKTQTKTTQQPAAPAQQNAAWPAPQQPQQQGNNAAWPAPPQQQPAQAAWPAPATIPGSQPTWPGQAPPPATR
jgi:hypothetical protein